MNTFDELFKCNKNKTVERKIQGDNIMTQVENTHSFKEFAKHPLVNTVVAALVGILCVYFSNKLKKSDDESRTII